MAISDSERSEIWRLHSVDGLSVGTIARLMGRHHSTVARAIANRGGRPKANIRKRASKLDAFADLIAETLAAYPRMPASNIYHIAAKHGYAGSEATMRRKVAELRPRKSSEAFLRLSVPPGEQAQVDRAEFGTIASGNGERTFGNNMMGGSPVTKPNEYPKLRRAIDEGVEITGGAIGSALGLISGDPALAPVLGAAGVAAGSALRQVGNEFAGRVLGPRERKRLGAAVSVIASDIHKRTLRGEKVRTDGFFTENPNKRSDAEEVAESVLLKCQREPEEKKIQYMGHFFANVAFDPQISAEMAHQLAKHAEQMTYRQFCILKIAICYNYRPRLREGDYRGQSIFSVELQEVLYECFHLYGRGFVNFGGDVAFGPTDIKPRTMKAQGLGLHLATLLNVALIPESDLAATLQQLG